MLRYFFIIPVFIFFFSCKNNTEDPLDTPIVRVGNKELTKHDLYDIIPDGISKNDSIIFAQDFMNRWIRSELMLRKAELNLSPEEKNVTKLLEEYRRSLLVNQYQQKMLQQKYTPMITDREINAYYDKMIDNFILNENIIKGVFIIIPRSAPNIKDIRKWYKSDKKEDIVNMEAYCFQNARKYDVFLEKWKPLSMINHQLPHPIANTGSFLKHNKSYETSDTVNYYFLSIRDYKLVHDKAPLEYVENRIKAILLNKKRINFINQLESDLYDEGLKQKIIKFY